MTTMILMLENLFQIECDVEGHRKIKTKQQLRQVPKMKYYIYQIYDTCIVTKTHIISSLSNTRINGNNKKVPVLGHTLGAPVRLSRSRHNQCPSYSLIHHYPCLACHDYGKILLGDFNRHKCSYNAKIECFTHNCLLPFLWHRAHLSINNGIDSTAFTFLLMSTKI